jgi:hypothetical protein
MTCDCSLSLTTTRWLLFWITHPLHLPPTNIVP